MKRRYPVQGVTYKALCVVRSTKKTTGNAGSFVRGSWTTATFIWFFAMITYLSGKCKPFAVNIIASAKYTVCCRVNTMNERGFAYVKNYTSA